MTKPRKIVIAVMLLFSVLVPAWSTGMPVIDISAIANAIAEFSTTVQQYQKQVMQWKSEYDRLAKAAQSIAKGDFDSVLNGISQAATMISGYSSDLAFFADVSAAAQTGRKLAKDGKKMTNSIESTWSNFLHKVDSPSSAGDAINVLWDIVALTPVSETFAASDILTKDFLTDTYIKKLKNEEQKELISERASSLADAIKARDDAAELKNTTAESVLSAEELLNKTREAWVAAQNNLADLQQKLQASAREDGDTESNQTRELRAAAEAARSGVDSAHKAYIEAQSSYDAMKKADAEAGLKYDEAMAIAKKRKEEMDLYVQDLVEEDNKKNAVDKELEKMDKSYKDVQKTRIDAYIKAHTYNPIPSYIPEEAYASDAALHWYLKNGTMEGFE